MSDVNMLLRCPMQITPTKKGTGKGTKGFTGRHQINVIIIKIVQIIYARYSNKSIRGVFQKSIATQKHPNPPVLLSSPCQSFFHSVFCPAWPLKVGPDAEPELIGSAVGAFAVV